MMEITRESAGGSELGSRPVARVLLVLQEQAASTAMSASLLPTSVPDGGDSYLPAFTGESINALGSALPMNTEEDPHAPTDNTQNGSYGNGTYPADVSLASASDIGAVAESPEDEEMRDLAPAHAEDVLAPAHPLIRLLAAAGHVVAWTTHDDWQLDTQGGRELTRPHVIMIEGNAPQETLVSLSSALRASETGRDAAILTILPPAKRADRKRAMLLEALGDSGADDFLLANATDAEVLARVRMLADFARTRHDLAAAREQLRTQLQTDDQTRLLNRRFFFQSAHRECSRARRYNSELSCLMIEVDHFKRLAAITGFDCSEAMLRAVALVLRDLTRDSDIVARFDEDKFAILLPETTLEGATRLREKIQQAVAALDFNWHSCPVPLSVSGGEANRNREIRAVEDAAQRLDLDDDDAGEHIDGEPLSAREELAELLSAADAALFVARRGVRFPTLVGEFAQEKNTRPLGDDSQQLPSLS